MFNQHQSGLRQLRAKNTFRDGNDFLMREATNDIAERLGAVKRTFDQAAVLFGGSSYAADMIENLPNIENVTRVERTHHLGNANHLSTPDLLSLEANSFDLIIAPLTLHWSNDLPGTLIQIRQSLKSDGLFLGNLPGPDTLVELRRALLVAESETSAGAANRIDPFTDIRDAGALLQRAGFALPVVDQETLTVRYDNVLKLVQDLRSFGATHHPKERVNPPLNRQALQRLVEIYAEQSSDADGRVRATFSFVSLSGWVPHESQQKPLKPGSAKARLADALNVDEIKLKS